MNLVQDLMMVHVGSVALWVRESHHVLLAFSEGYIDQSRPYSCTSGAKVGACAWSLRVWFCSSFLGWRAQGVAPDRGCALQISHGGCCEGLVSMFQRCSLQD